MKIEAWSKSDVGTTREHNEDSMLVDHDLAIFAVADGMGGHRGGAVASKLAIQTFRKVMAAGETVEFFDGRADTLVPTESNQAKEGANDASADEFESDDATPPADSAFAGTGSLAKEAASQASIAVFDRSAHDSELKGMGTTLTALVLNETYLQLVHVGDSRAYRYRKGNLEQLTRDHSWVEEQLSSGSITEDEARLSEYKHVITRSIGFERKVEVDSARYNVEGGDLYLLCSDGLSNYVELGELETFMGRTDASELPSVLVDLANSRGGDDNITVIVFRIS